MGSTGLSEEMHPLDLLETALHELSSQFLPNIDRAELGPQCVRLLSARDQLDAVMATTVAEAERADVPTLGKQRTMAQYLASRTHCAPDTIRADVRVGLWVSDFPLLEHAMLNGELSRRHVDLLRKTQNIRVFTPMQHDQELFIDLAHKLEWNSFKQAVHYWLEINDQDAPQPEDHEAKNTCTINRQADGRIKIALNLDPLSGATVTHQIETEAGRLFDQDQEDTSIVRTATQRRARALTNLVERGAGRTENTTKPLVHVVMSLKVLEHSLAQLAKPVEEQDFTSVLDSNDIDGRCELADGTPLHPKYALLLLMTARIRRQVLTAKNVTLNASYDTRLFPEWMKHIRLIETRGQCETAGCDALGEWLRADHHKPFTQTQQTTLADLRTICDPDNKTKGAGPPLAERNPTTTQPEPSHDID